METLICPCSSDVVVFRKPNVVELELYKNTISWEWVVGVIDLIYKNFFFKTSSLLELKFNFGAIYGKQWQKIIHVGNQTDSK